MFRSFLAARHAAISSQLLFVTSCFLAILLTANNLRGQDAPTVKTSNSEASSDQKVTVQKPVLPADAAPLPQKEIYRRLLRSTAYIISLDKEGKPKGSGSGWLLDKDRKLLVTNHHVVESLGKLRVYFPQYNNDRPITDKESYWKTAGISAEILIADAKKDLAVLKLAEVPSTAVAAVLADESPSPGDLVCSIGSPGSSSALWIFTTGTVRSVYRVKNDAFDGTIIETQSPINPGDSGGPAVNDRNQLVGVVFSYNTAARLSSNFVDLSEVKKFTERANLLYEPKTAAHFVLRGINAKENKRLDAAIGDFTSALKLQPKHADAFTRRGDCFLEQRDYQTALSDYNDAIAADPNLSSAFAGRARVYRVQRKYDDALTDTTTAIRLRPNYYYPSFFRGLIYLDKQDPSSALTDFERALKLTEKNPVAKYQTLSELARAHEMAGDYKAAVDDYVAALNIKPSEMALYRRMGDMLLDKAHDPQKAFHAANAALEQQPNYFYALLLRGRAQVALNNPEDGVRDLTAAIRAADGNSQRSSAYFQRGLVYDNRGELKNAATDYLDAIVTNGDDSRAFSHLGALMLFKAKEPSTAVNFFTEAIKQQPKSPFAHRERGRAYRYLNQPDKAISDLDEAIRLNPKLASSHDYRGDYFLARRDFDSAIRDYSAALELNSHESIFHYDLASALSGKGDFRAAVKSFDAAIKLNPKYTSAYVNRSIARFRLGDKAGSQADMQVARGLDPSLKNREVKQRYANYLRLKNETKEPLMVYVQYYTPTADGNFRWYPTEPGPDGRTIYVRLEPGEGTELIDLNYEGMNIKGARFRIWARGINSNRDFTQNRDTDVIAVSKEGYVSDDYGTTEYTFRP